MGMTVEGRTAWVEAPEAVRRRIAEAAGSPVVGAADLGGGYSPGVVAILRLADGRAVFAKAVADVWGREAESHRSEIRVARAMGAGVAAPRMVGAFAAEAWTGMVFEAVAEGREPRRPWDVGELARVMAALRAMAAVPAAAGIGPGVGERPLAPRLGGWTSVAAEAERVRQLAGHSPWAADNLRVLIELEARGLAAAAGDRLVHHDLHPGNILLTGDRVVFVDWAFARPGNPLVDVVGVLSSAVADGLDVRDLEPDDSELDGLIAAHAGFCVRAAIRSTSERRRALMATKLRLGLGAVRWLAARIGDQR